MLKRRLTLLLLCLLIVSLVVPSFISSVSSSSGPIRINSKTASAPGQQVQAGGNVNLYFGNVVWSGMQFYLFLSTDGSTQITTGNVYTPVFSVYDVANTTVPHVYNDDIGGHWIVGSNWVNGTIPSTQAIGNWYIKAIDEIASTVAVTDTYITVNPIIYDATLNILPSAGSGGVPITFTGQGYPIQSNVVLSYYDPSVDLWNFLTQTTSNASGQINVNSTVPDLRKSVGMGDCPETYNTISYRAEINGITYSYASYDQYARGLTKIGNATAYGLFGNGTNLVSSVRVMAGDTLEIAGRWFHSGAVYVRWDSTNIVGTVMDSEWQHAAILNSTLTGNNGSFSTTITIPNAAAGEHYIAVEDSQTWIVFKIFVQQASLLISPSSGPGGATVQFSGTGYPHSTVVTLLYYDSSFGTWNFWKNTTSNAAGDISFSSEMPDLARASVYYGETSLEYSSLSFRTDVNGVPYGYGQYNEYYRGLTRVGSQVASYGVYGNGSDFTSNINLRPGDSLLISGVYFRPGVVYIRFDGSAVVGTVTSDQWRTAQVIGTTTASSTGSFSVYVTIPTANSGAHYIAVEDPQARVITRVNVTSPSSPSPTPTPTDSGDSGGGTNPSPTPTPNPALPTPSIELVCKSTTTNGLKVDISGTATLDGVALQDQPVLLSYSVTDGSTWDSLTLVRTLSDGSFSATWMPSVTGNYLLKATVEGTASMNGVAKIVNLVITPDSSADSNVFTLTSNSTIRQFTFDPDTKQLSFTAEGPSNSAGYVNIFIPKTVLSDISTLKTYLDGNEISFTSQSQSDAWLISFSYHHSTHTIVMSLGGAISLVDAATFEGLIFIVPVLVAVIAVAAFALQRSRKPHQ
jgi:hypothetical protein